MPVVGSGFDVLVIGGGIAGAAAALAAAARGRRVALVRAAPGTTALAAGGWAGPLPDGMGAALAGVGLPYEPAGVPLPHPAGRLDGYDRAAPAHRAAVPLGGAVVCGIVGLPGFPARALARAWGARSGAELAAAVLAAGPVPRGGWSPASLAAWLEREPLALAGALADAVRRAGASRALLPAVLGIERADEVRAALERAAGVPVGEALGVPPSAPGWRLDRAIEVALERAGVTVVRGRVVDRVASGRRVRAVIARPAGGHDGNAVRLEADGFVLATGKYLAGGIRAGDRFEEPALGCPVWVERLGTTFERPDPLALTDPDRADDQPLLRAGVRTDAGARPVDRAGDVVYENVRVAGSVRAGVESATLGLGHAADDGWRAGELAAEAAG
ncbi:MAG TPA: FAD-binding protein [Longimicrobiales bacterium]